MIKITFARLKIQFEMLRTADLKNSLKEK